MMDTPVDKKPQVDVVEEVNRNTRRREARKALKEHEKKKKKHEEKKQEWRRKGLGEGGIDHPAHNRTEMYMTELQRNPGQAKMRFRGICQLYLIDCHNKMWETDDNKVAAEREKKYLVAMAELSKIDRYYARCQPTTWPDYFVDWCGDGVTATLCSEWVKLYAGTLKPAPVDTVAASN